MNTQIDLKGMKKRIKGKLMVMERKRNRKIASRSRSGAVTTGGKERRIKGRNVDYYRYLLLFRLKDNPKQLDSLVVEHTSQYKTLIELDQVRLDYKVDTMTPKKIIMVYIKKYYHDTLTQGEHAYIAKGRVRAIRKRLHHAGIPLSKIKVLQDSLSPPRL